MFVIYEDHPAFETEFNGYVTSKEEAEQVVKALNEKHKNVYRQYVELKQISVDNV